MGGTGLLGSPRSLQSGGMLSPLLSSPNPLSTRLKLLALVAGLVQRAGAD